jgi:hypothetical protein
MNVWVDCAVETTERAVSGVLNLNFYSLLRIIIICNTGVMPYFRSQLAKMPGELSGIQYDAEPKLVGRLQ